jgi:hypothetical protein
LPSSKAGSLRHEEKKKPPERGSVPAVLRARILPVRGFQNLMTLFVHYQHFLDNEKGTV